MADLAVALGVQGAQTHTSAGRGLARYVRDQTRSLLAYPAAKIVQLSFDPSLPAPVDLAPRDAGVELAPSTERPAAPGRLVYHVLSPFELLGIDRVWPRWAQSTEVGLVVTLHDLIPLIYRDVYLADPHLRKWYLPRLELIRNADAVVAISQATAADAENLLGVASERLFVSGEDASPVFQAAAAAAAPPAGVRPGFVLSVGGLDTRKNVPRLVDAYAGLPPDVRSAHQLVLVGTWLAHERRELGRLAARSGAGGDIHLQGQVTDTILATLYQACHLFVMPSIYEGFGLPVLEAMRCGAPVIAADSSSLRELVTQDDARFDPLSTPALRECLLRGLVDTSFRDRLRAGSDRSAARFSWRHASSVVARAYRHAAERRSGFA